MKVEDEPITNKIILRDKEHFETTIERWDNGADDKGVKITQFNSLVILLDYEMSDFIKALQTLTTPLNQSEI